MNDLKGASDGNAPLGTDQHGDLWWLLPQARWTASTFIAVIAAATPNAAFEKALARDVPSLSQPDLRRIGNYMRHEIARGKIPGAIVLIQQHGKPVYFEKFGARDVTARLPMTDDTIFRLYSMSKPNHVSRGDDAG